VSGEHRDPDKWITRHRRNSAVKVIQVALAVAIIYLVSVLVLWLLTLIGPVDAAVEGFVEHTGGNVWFAAGGLLGAFVLMAGLGLLALRTIAKDILKNLGQALVRFSGW
jgi:hypothetical protein